jgi:hypothetical protein
MSLPEGFRRGRIRDSELFNDESVEVWDNAVEKSARARGIEKFIIVIIINHVESKLEGV